MYGMIITTVACRMSAVFAVHGNFDPRGNLGYEADIVFWNYLLLSLVSRQSDHALPLFQVFFWRWLCVVFIKQTVCCVCRCSMCLSEGDLSRLYQTDCVLCLPLFQVFFWRWLCVVRCFSDGDSVWSLSNRPCVVFAAVLGVFLKVTLSRLYQTDRVLCLPLFQVFFWRWLCPVFIKQTVCCVCQGEPVFC